MTAWLIRRLLYAVPVLIGVNLLTFLLFFVVNTPDNMARMHLGMKHVSVEAVAQWKAAHGYDKPLLYNAGAAGLESATDTIFYRHSVRLFVFDFGRSDSGRDIGYDIRSRMGPSLAIALPTFVIGLATYIGFALLMVMFRGSALDTAGVVACVMLMSVSGLFYIILGQYLFGKVLHLVPISGYAEGVSAIRFVILPVLIGVVAGLGGSARLNRAFFLEEIGRDYVRTARAKGLSEMQVLFRHVLGNALLPILTRSVVVLPSLFMGSLIMEAFFGIPGLGSYTLDAIQSQDFAIVRAMVFLGSVLYIVGLILTDLSYAVADPRVRLA